MNEKKFALQIQKELKDSIATFGNEQDYLGCMVNKTLDEINNLNINTLINECKLLNIDVEYANKMKKNQKYWNNVWNIKPCLVFSFNS